jgi:putative membrane protein
VNPLALVAASVAAGIHVFFFVLESIRFRQPATWRRFNIESQRDADLMGPMAFNQGFYNLFLAVGALGGIVAILIGRPEIGRTLIFFTCGSMALAGLVLVVTDRRLAGSALIQSTAPIVAILAGVLFG